MQMIDLRQHDCRPTPLKQRSRICQLSQSPQRKTNITGWRNILIFLKNAISCEFDEQLFSTPVAQNGEDEREKRTYGSSTFQMESYLILLLELGLGHLLGLNFCVLFFHYFGLFNHFVCLYLELINLWSYGHFN